MSGLEATAAAELRQRTGAEVLQPGDEEYERLRPDYAVPGEPACIVRPASTQAVTAIVRFAADHDLPISVRSGGHGAAAFANRGGLVIDLSRMARIDVGDGGIVRIGGGATWGAVAEALAPYRLALSSGDTRSVGVGGLTLGGGIGWMVREHGLALDSLVEAEVVLADGRVVTASDGDNPDLFWALRGGGGNFGVVTRFTFHAHLLGTVVFGALTFGGDDLSGLLRGWRDAMRRAPEALNTTVLAMPASGPEPPGVQILTCWAGAAEDVDSAVAPLLALPGLRGADLAPMPYADVLEEPQRPEDVRMVDYNGFCAEFDDATIDALVAAREGAGSPVLMTRYLRGALNRVEPGETAFGYRDIEAFLVLAAFLPLDADPEVVDGIRRRFAALDAHTVGTYSNFSSTVGEDTTARIFPPETLERLRALKRRYDPGNLFARNHNIRPAEGAVVAMTA